MDDEEMVIPELQRPGMEVAVNNAVTAPVSLSEQEEASQFDPNDHVLGLLRGVLADPAPATVEAPHIGALHIVPERGEYFTDLSAPQLERLFACAPASCAIKRLVARDLEATTAARHGRNVDELMWNATLCVAHGRLMRGCRRDDVVLLKHWPNLTRLMTTPNSVRIAALLTRYPTSIALAYRLLKVPQAELNDFYSAARAAGWAVAVNRKPEAPAADVFTPHRQRGLLAQVLRRIMRL